MLPEKGGGILYINGPQYKWKITRDGISGIEKKWAKKIRMEMQDSLGKLIEFGQRSDNIVRSGFDVALIEKHDRRMYRLQVAIPYGVFTRREGQENLLGVSVADEGLVLDYPNKGDHALTIGDREVTSIGVFYPADNADKHSLPRELAFALNHRQDLSFIHSLFTGEGEIDRRVVRMGQKTRGYPTRISIHFSGGSVLSFS